MSLNEQYAILSSQEVKEMVFICNTEQMQTYKLGSVLKERTFCSTIGLSNAIVHEV